ncbi:MAG TPA: alpha/beta fold hydrolase [Planctomycetota bacterium]|nr:alpha/beta fold hydrolase [Planctomycetota bacterium]
MHLVVLTAAAFLCLPRPAPEPAPPVRTESSERVVLTTDDKLSLVGTWWAPKGKQIAPGALLVHDSGGQRQDLAEYGERLKKMGFAVLSIDLRGHGESASGALNWKALDESARERTWAFTTRDLKAGAEFLRNQKAVHSASLVVIGYGSGCTLAARHAVRDENVRAVALLAPPHDPADMYGFQLGRDIDELGGLPTYVSVTREGRDAVQALVDEGRKANGGVDFITISVTKGAPIDILGDTREASELGRWLKEKAFPSKGSR